MRKRLFDGLDQGLGEEILLLEPLTPPGGGEVHCSLCWALERLLGRTGAGLSYPHLMALTGAAFMVPVGALLVPDWDQTGVPWRLPDGLARCEAVDAQASPEAVLAACREELQAGRALALQDADGLWAVVVGIKGDALLVQRAGSPRIHERQPPQARALVTGCGDRGEWGSLAAALDVLDTGGEVLAASQERWQAWQQALEAEEPYGAELERLERFLGEQLLTAAVIEARDCATGFLTDLAEQTDFELAESLEAAAQAGEQLLTALEQLLVPAEAVQIAHILEDGVWLDRRREVLETARHRDGRFREAMAQAADVAGDFH